MPTRSSEPGDLLDRRLLRLGPEDYPKILRISCSHPRTIDITTLGDPSNWWHWICATCTREWWERDW